MFKALAIGLLIFSSSAFAETKTYNIEGMHCEGCVDAVKAKVCGLEGISKCDVQIGKATLTTAGDAKLDDNAVTNAVQSAGYKVVEKPVKTAMSCDEKSKSCGESCSCDHKNGKHHKTKKSNKGA